MTFKEVYGDHSNEIYIGNLNISEKCLISLEGCYKEVQGNFYCYNNQLTSFEFCPDIKGDFNCHSNHLTSFEHCPNVQGDFVCNNNQLTSFEHCPDIKGNFYCSDNDITSLEYVPEIRLENFKSDFTKEDIEKAYKKLGYEYLLI